MAAVSALPGMADEVTVARANAAAISDRRSMFLSPCSLPARSSRKASRIRDRIANHRQIGLPYRRFIPYLAGGGARHPAGTPVAQTSPISRFVPAASARPTSSLQRLLRSDDLRYS